MYQGYRNGENVAPCPPSLSMWFTEGQRGGSAETENHKRWLVKAQEL